MPQRTPNPSGAMLLNQLPLAGVPNMPAVLNELLERLRVDFPNSLSAINPAVSPPRDPENYRLAPAGMLGDGYAHNVLVGNDLDFESVGTRVYFGGSTLQVMIVDEKRNSDFLILDYWSQVLAMASVLYSYLSGCVRTDGVVMWKKLVPQQVSGLPEQYAAGYHGVMLTYQMEFQQRSSGWPSSNTGTQQ